MSQLPVLAKDVDEVSFQQAVRFIAWTNELHGTNLTMADYTELWHELWGVDEEETERRKKLFFTEEIFRDFEPVEGAGRGITAVSSVRTVIAVTARRESLRAVTEQALELIAPGAVSRVVHATFFQGGIKIVRSKADICLEIEADELVDDQFKHCLAAHEVGVRAILFGDYHHNRDHELPDGMLRAPGWPELCDLVGAKF